MYRQIDGVPMGSPFSAILANAFLYHFEELWLSKCAPDILPEIFKRYVNDDFVIFLYQSHVNNLVNYMNTNNPNIKFTLKFEKKDSFSFLDLKLHIAITN